MAWSRVGDGEPKLLRGVVSRKGFLVQACTTGAHHDRTSVVSRLIYICLTQTLKDKVFIHVGTSKQTKTQSTSECGQVLCPHSSRTGKFRAHQAVAGDGGGCEKKQRCCSRRRVEPICSYAYAPK